MKRSLDLYTEHPGLWRIFLARIFGAVVGFRQKLYRAGVLKRRWLPARVISVGNLAVGGTGKTPAVIHIARGLQARGLRTAVLSRGYRGGEEERIGVVSDGEEIHLGPSQAGDEAYLLARSLPGVPVLCGRDRVRLGRYACELFGAEVLILDDGFQHLSLEREVNLLLVDARQPWGNGRLLPAGPLREPRAQAGRATAFLLTRAEERPAALMEELERDFPGRPIFAARHKPVRLVRLSEEEEQEPGFLAGRRVLAFCGLARPRTFLETLLRLGAEVPLFVTWPDHYQATGADLRFLEAKGRELGVWGAVTTGKDAVKLAGWSGLAPEVWVLEVEMELLDRAQEFMALMLPEDREA